MKPSIYFSHPTSNANVRAAAMGLNDADLLTVFQTSIASFPGSILDNMGRFGPLSEIRRRRFDLSLQKVTKTWAWYELGRIAALKGGFTNLTAHETGYFSIDAVYRQLDKHVANRLATATKKKVNSVYAYEDGAFFCFRQAKKLKMKCYYDLPIGHWRTAKRLLEEESFLKPAWAPTLTGLQDSKKKLLRKDEELLMADEIFVASMFTARSLADFPGSLSPVHIIPYGFPPVADQRTYESFEKNRKVRLLFVGGLSQRKGVADLFSAVAPLGSGVELTIVGRKTDAYCKALDDALLKHHWIPSLPHAEILGLMRQQDVLVFPSLFEGFGLVITEAMSQGTPVITTDRTVGPDVIKNGENGWLVEAGSSLALQEILEKIIEDPSVIEPAGRAAMKTASQRSWKTYGAELAETIIRLS